VVRSTNVTFDETLIGSPSLDNQTNLETTGLGCILDDYLLADKAFDAESLDLGGDDKPAIDIAATSSGGEQSGEELATKDDDATVQA
jgi:hypothetical protein